MLSWLALTVLCAAFFLGESDHVRKTRAALAPTGFFGTVTAYVATTRDALANPPACLVQALAPKRSNVAASRFGASGHERHIQLPAPDKANEIRRWCALTHLDLHSRMTCRVRANELAQKASPDGWLNPNADSPARAPARFSRSSGRKLQRPECVARLLDESRSRIRHLQAPRAPLEQRHPECVLERAHATADSRLADAQLLCGAPEAKVVGNGERPADRCGIDRSRFREALGG